MNEKRMKRFAYDPAHPPRDDTDWARIDAMTEQEIDAAARTDPDAPPLTAEERAELRPVIDAKTVREATGLTQEEFARTFALPLGTLRDWEQHRTRPDRAAENYLRVIATDPQAARRAVRRRTDNAGVSAA
ncbi:MAG: helix-turn-helix domain-containing protein [Rhodospirillales bacterium]